MKAVHAVVSGAVQGVGYRQGCHHMARSLDLVGWVRNRADGTVELFAQGDETGVDRLVDWLWVGPRSSRVVGVETEVVATNGYLTDFLIQPSVRTPGNT